MRQNGRMDRVGQQLERLGPEGRDLRRAALRFCRKQPVREEYGFPEERREEFPRAEHLARLAVALDELDLAREIGRARHRVEAEARILHARGDETGLRHLIELTSGIEDRNLFDETVRGLVEADLDTARLQLLTGPVLKMKDWQLRDGLLARLAVELNDPDIACRILEDETKVGPLSRIARHTGRVDLARDALGIARETGEERLLLPPFAASPQVGDEDFLRRCLGIVSAMHDFEFRIAAMDLLGGCDFRNDLSRRAYRMIQTLPEFEPDEDDDGLWEGSRDIPLSHLAERHGSVTLARRVNGKFFRDYPLAVIATDRNDLELVAEISDIGTRALVFTSIARKTGNLDLLDRTLDRCADQPKLEDEWFGAAVAKLTLLLRHGSRQLNLPLSRELA